MSAHARDLIERYYAARDKVSPEAASMMLDEIVRLSHYDPDAIAWRERIERSVLSGRGTQACHGSSDRKDQVIF